MADRARRRLLLLLLVLFVGSGCSALIYEVVWFQLLQLVIGSSAVSMGVLLGTFMGGLCLGSLALPHLVAPRHHPLRVYAALELATGIVAVIAVFAVPLVANLYTAGVGHGLEGIALRAAACALCLLPPTMLMGATLPAIARWMGSSSRGVSSLGLLYGGNIAGAVLGSLVAGFYLLRVHDAATAAWAAALINAAVAAIALAASMVVPRGSSTATLADEHADEAAHAWRVYTVIALSGATALGAEIVWTRVLALMFGATIYTFSIILAVFLTGLGLGSAAASVLLRRRKIDARAALGVCQFLTAAAIAWTAWLVARSLPYWPGPADAENAWALFSFDLVRLTVALLPATLLWGASFPMALAAAACREEDAGHLVGRVYAANTLGAIVGAIGFGTLIVPLVGSAHAERTLIVLAAGSALLMIGPLARAALISKTAMTIGLIAAAVVLTSSVPAIPPLLVAYGRTLAASGTPAILYSGEGLNAAVAVSELPSGVRSFHVSGKVEASSDPQDMRLQRMLAALPALVHDQPRSVLVVGFGAGVTAGSFVPDPEIRRLVICEIESLIPERVAPLFEKENHGVLRDPRVEIVIDDARHYVLTSQETFDVITSDPIHPWVKGAATLYTTEYFGFLKQHLNPGGVVTQWVPLYESSPDVVRSEIATFFSVFPSGAIWGNPHNGRGYDLVLMGWNTPPGPIDIDAIERRLGQPGLAGLAASLGEVGFRSGIDLLATFAGTSRDLQPWLDNAEINRDRNLRLQYLAGLGLRSLQSEYVYDQILAYRRIPTDVFAASEPAWQLWNTAVAKLRAGP